MRFFTCLRSSIATYFVYIDLNGCDLQEMQIKP